MARVGTWYDAALIVALRNAAPELIAELRRLRAAEREAEERGARWALEARHGGAPGAWQGDAVDICAKRRGT